MRTLLSLLIVFVASCSGADGPESDSALGPVSAEVQGEQAYDDARVLRALADAGSDLSQAHDLEHHFVCTEPAAAEPVLAWAVAHGFTPSAVTEDEFEGEAYAWFDLVKPTLPELEIVTQDTLAMRGLEARFDVEYDGWGCQVVR